MFDEFDLKSIAKKFKFETVELSLFNYIQNKQKKKKKKEEKKK